MVVSWPYHKFMSVRRGYYLEGKRHQAERERAREEANRETMQTM